MEILQHVLRHLRSMVVIMGLLCPSSRVVNCLWVSHFHYPEHIFYAIWCRMTKRGVVVHHGMAQRHAL